MAIDDNTARFLVDCRDEGASFARTLTLGRQALLLRPASVRAVLRRIDRATDGEAMLAKAEGYADGLFALLGAKELITVDYSGYEGATLIHDMNLPWPADHTGKFDLVFDGGTLEHIFNFPCALRNCMELVKPGGHLVLHTPTNNWCGHGFYQFSPELFFRALSRENGYKVERMVAYEAYPNSAMYEVSDPEHVRSRVELTHGHHRVLLLVRARRIQETEIFKHPPQQSDYVDAWMGGSKPSRKAPQPTATMKVKQAWAEGRLGRVLKKHLVALTGSDALVDAYENRWLSLRGQPKMFRPVADRKDRHD